jgi:RTX calcium-binding nonapeptide repeat (4 copies)
MRSNAARPQSASRRLGASVAWLFAIAAACLLATCAGAAQAPDQTHGLRGTARFDVGLYTAYCPRGARMLAATRAHGQDAAVQPDPPLAVAGAPAQAAGGSGYGEATGAADEAFAQESESDAPATGEAASDMPEGTVFDYEGAAVAHAASTSEAGWPAKQCLKMDKGAAGHSHTIVGLDGVHNWLLGGYGNDTIVGGNSGDVIWADYHPNGEPSSQTAVIEAGDGRNVIYANDTRDYVWTGTNPHTVVHAHVSGISGVIHCQAAGIVVYLSSVSERRFKLDGCRRISHYSVGY